MSQESVAAGKGISTPGEDDDTVTTTGRGPGAPAEETSTTIGPGPGAPDDGRTVEPTEDDGSVGTDGRGPG